MKKWRAVFFVSPKELCRVKKFALGGSAGEGGGIDNVVRFDQTTGA